MAFKDANAAYGRSDYKKAIDEVPGGARQDNPNLSLVYFYLANSYDNLYKPAKKGAARERRQPDRRPSSYYKKAPRRSPTRS